MQNTLLECTEEKEMSERGNGRIYTRNGSPFYWLSYYANGEEQREVATHPRTGKKLEAIERNHRDAERALKLKVEKVITARHTGQRFIGPQQQRVTVLELLKALEQDYALRDKLNVKVKSNLKPIRDYFGCWRAAEVTPEAVATYIQQQREQEYSNGTINRRTQLLGQAFKLAIRNKHLSVAPFIPRLSEVGSEREGFFEAENFEAVVKHLPDYLQDFARFGFLTGWRKGSIQKLRWCDVTDDVVILRAENSKTRKPETVPLHGELAELIKRRRAVKAWHDKEGQAHISEYVFHVNGEPVGDYRKAWHSACAAAGIGKMVCPQCEADVEQVKNGKKVEYKCSPCGSAWKHRQLKHVGPIFHDLRRTAARNMVAAGVPPQVAMKITGHRTDAMFRRYAIVNEDQKRDALARTAAYLAATANRKVLAMASNR